MKDMLLKVLKVVHWIVWFPLIPFFGSDYPQRFFCRDR